MLVQLLWKIPEECKLLSKTLYKNLCKNHIFWYQLCKNQPTLIPKRTSKVFVTNYSSFYYYSIKEYFRKQNSILPSSYSVVKYRCYLSSVAMAAPSAADKYVCDAPGWFSKYTSVPCRELAVRRCCCQPEGRSHWCSWWQIRMLK